MKAESVEFSTVPCGTSLGTVPQHQGNKICSTEPQEALEASKYSPSQAIASIQLEPPENYSADFSTIHVIYKTSFSFD